MAITVVVNIAKKIPGAQEYSSTQASISITAECTNGDPVGEAEKLYRQAEAAVDKQLGIQTSAHQHNGHNHYAGPTQQSTSNGHNNNNGSEQSRRRRNGSPPSTENQIRLLSRLLSSDQNKANDILQYYRVGRIEELTVSQASEVIDSLKSGTSR